VTVRWWDVAWTLGKVDLIKKPIKDLIILASWNVSPSESGSTVHVVAWKTSKPSEGGGVWRSNRSLVHVKT
jgi:hypothetical protein